MKWLPIAAVTAPAQTAVLIEDPLLAVGGGVALALIGVTSAWLTSSDPLRLRFLAGRYLAAIVVSILAFGLGSLIFNNNLILIGLSGASGLLLDISLAILEKQMRQRGGLDDEH